MIKPNNRASPEGKQADLATLEKMHSPFGGWRQHLSSGAGGSRSGGRGPPERRHYKTAAKPPPQPSGPKAPSNLRTLRTFGPEARQPSRPKGRVQRRSRPESIAFILSIV